MRAEAGGLRPWAGLSRPVVLAPDLVFWALVLIVVMAVFVIDHHWEASLRFTSRERADLGATLAYIGHGATRPDKFLAYGLLAFTGLALFALPARKGVRVEGATAFCALALLAWAALSVLWTTDTGVTLRRGGVLAIMTVAAAGAIRRLSLRKIAELVTFTAGIFLVLGIGAEIALGSFHPYRGSYRFAGTLHPNHQGANTALALLGGLWLATSDDVRWSRRWLGLGLAVLAFAFMYLTKSRSGFMSGAAAASVLLLLRMPGRYSFLAPTAMVATVSSVFFLLASRLVDTPWSLILLGRNPEQLATLTDRLPLWEAMLMYAGERPLHGFGYGAFVNARRADVLTEEVGEIIIGGPHSVYMSLLLDLGVVGLLLFTCLVLLAIGKAIGMFSRSGNPVYAFFVAAFVFLLLNGVLEAPMVFPTVHLFPVLLLGAIAFTSARSVGSAAGGRR